MQGLRKGLPESPIAQRSIFGWLLNGPISQPCSITTHCHAGILALNPSRESTFLKEIKHFWEIEEIPNGAPNPISSEDQFCETHFQQTHQRNADGWYTVELPLLPHLNGCAQLGESRSAAERRLKQIERRMSNNDVFSSRYHAFMTEFLNLNHMEPLSTNTCCDETFYLPHHGITKEQSSTTKLRVVFDGSQKTSNGFSLNDRLCNGPKLQ